MLEVKELQWKQEGNKWFSQKFEYGQFRVSPMLTGTAELHFIFNDGTWMELGVWDSADDAMGEVYSHQMLIEGVFNSGIEYATGLKGGR